jgi:hypothetical protein
VRETGCKKKAGCTFSALPVAGRERVISIQPLAWGEQLQAEVGLPPRLRQSIQEFTNTIRKRRTQWAAGLVLTASAE